MMSVNEFMDAVAAGEDLAAEDAAFVFRTLSPDAWDRALKRRRKIEEREAAEESDDDFKL